METPMTTLFQNNVNNSLNVALEDMGPVAREVILDSLASRGIRQDNIITRFGDVVRILAESLGSSSRIIVLKMLKELNKRFYEDRLLTMGLS